MEGLTSLRPVPPGAHGYYCDLAYVPIKVCAVQLREEGGRVALQLWDATCGLEEFMLASSAPPAEAQPIVRPPQPPENWRCKVRFYVNYPSQRVCYRCKWPRATRWSRKARKRGQVMPRVGAK